MKNLIAVFVLGLVLAVTAHAQSDGRKLSSAQIEVANLGRSYTDMIRRADAASISNILADDYIVTDEVGTVLTKEQDLATYKDRAKSVKIETVEYRDQRVRMITNDVAIEHSTIRFAGTRNGKPFDFTERITTTWARRNGRWQIVADHFSFVKP